MSVWLWVLLLVMSGGMVLPDAHAREMRDVCHTETPLLSRVTEDAMEDVRERYEQLVEEGKPGTAPGILRERLMLEGDLKKGEALEVGIRRFQRRHGLEVTGMVGKKTRALLETPLKVWLRRIDDTLVLLREKLEAENSKRMVTVNIPAAEVEAVERGTVVGRYRAVVGAQQRPSSPLSTRITELNFHPTWTVPYYIAQLAVIPEERKAPGYLVRHGIHVYDKHGREIDPAQIDWLGEEPKGYTYRQEPGPLNPMGKVRLNMPNALQFYMHDTPVKDLFEKRCRMKSNGCVRVEEIDKLSAWLLKHTPEWDLQRVREVMASGIPQTVRLEPPVRVDWVYFLAWATPEGVACFRPDVYLFENARVKAK